MTAEPRKLYRSTHDAWVAGVASGVAEFFGLDKTVVRVAFALVIVFTFFTGLVAYLVMWLVIPPRPYGPPPVVAPPPQP